MALKKVVHLMQADKFTLPLLYHLNAQFGSTHQQLFFVLNNDNLTINKAHLYQNTTVIENCRVSGFNAFKNAVSFLIKSRNASVVIMHGNALLFYLFLIQHLVKKTFWIIYGGADMKPWEQKHKLDFRVRLLNRIKFATLRRMYGHITFIKGDSDLANKTYNSHAKHVHSPVYLSNIIDTKDFNPSKIDLSRKVKVLVGNSCSPSNNHLQAFEWLLPYKDKIEVICPLSYGNYPEYKNEVTAAGEKYFGDNFQPITQFMDVNEYKQFLKHIDIAVFNHHRQEAMGVTLMLLGLGKKVYVYPSTTAFQMFQSLGFQIFSNSLLVNKDELVTDRRTDLNKALLEQFNSFNYLNQTWFNVYHAA